MQRGDFYAEGDGEGGQEGGGQWGGGIFMMECLGGHTFPEQRRVTQLVENKFSKLIHLNLHVYSDYYTELQIRLRSLPNTLAVTIGLLGWESNPRPHDLLLSAYQLSYRFPLHEFTEQFHQGFLFTLQNKLPDKEKEEWVELNVA